MVVVPFIPSAIPPHHRDDNDNVINKTIVYSDTVLPLKDLGNNLKINSISNVSEQDIESCLKTIFESNSDVLFNTIQYSRKDKKIYFYTDKPISTKAWEEKHVIEYKPIRNSQEIIEEISNILTQEPTKDPEVISVFDVERVMGDNYRKIDALKSKYENYLEKKLKNTFDCCTIIIIEPDDLYHHRQLEIKFGYRYGLNQEFDHSKMIFAMELDDLYLLKSDNPFWAKRILSCLGADLYQFCDSYLRIVYNGRGISNIIYLEPVNSHFGIEIGEYGVYVGTKQLAPTLNQWAVYFSDFVLSSYYHSNEYEIKCNSVNVKSAIKNCNIIFKRIYVKIADLPEWSQSIFREMRKNELLEQERQEELKRQQEYERQQLEAKRQKRLALKRIFMPWSKK